MSDTIREKAAQSLAMVEEVTAVVLPEPKDANAVVTLAEADAPLSAEITSRMAEIDMEDTQSIVAFGSAAQAELQEISQSMLQDVRNKDVGPAGDSLRSIVTTIRGFSVSELDVRRKRSWWERLLGRAAPFARFTAKFEKVQGQIDKITDNLLNHEHTLLKDRGQAGGTGRQCDPCQGSGSQCRGGGRSGDPCAGIARHPRSAG